MKKFLGIITAAAMLMTAVPFVTIETSAMEIAINSENFPDEIFRQDVYREMDNNKDYILTEREAIAEVGLVCSPEVRSLQGIEYLTGITSLTCYDLYVENVVLDKNTNLSRVELIDSPAIYSISLGANTNLETLVLTNTNIGGQLDLGEYTGLKTIDLSRSKRLETLMADGLPNLTTLDVSDTRCLSDIYVNKSGLTSIDLSTCSYLQNFYASETKFTSVDFTGNKELVSVYFNNAKIESLNLSGFQNLSKVSAYHSPNLTTLNVSNTPNLYSIDAYSSGLTSIDVSTCPSLKSLGIQYTSVSSLDVSNNPLLYTLKISHTDIDRIDVSKNPALFSLDIDGTPISSLDLSNNPDMQYLEACETNLVSLDLSSYTKLETLRLRANKSLRSLDVTGCSALDSLDLEDTPLGYLNLDGTPAIEDFTRPCSRGEAYFNGNKLDLKAFFDEDFDVSRVSNVVGGAISGNYLIMDSGAEEILYDYNTANSSVGALTFAIEPGTLMGDVNLDGVVDIDDARLVLSCYASQSAGMDYTFHEDSAKNIEALIMADVDGDGSITLDDARYILIYYAQYSAGLSADWGSII